MMIIISLSLRARTRYGTESVHLNVVDYICKEMQELDKKEVKKEKLNHLLHNQIII